MDELQTRAGSGVTVLDGLATQARLLTQSLMLNYVQLGRVLCEAKGLVRHGEWGAWLQENAPVGERLAQQMMQVYKRFGDKPNLLTLDSSKLVKMLALPAGTEDDFVAENDVPGMSAREVESAIQEQTKGARESDPVPDPVPPAESAPIPDEVLQELQTYKDKAAKYEREVELVKETAQDAVSQLNEASAEKARLERENRMQASMLANVQASAKAAQDELLSMKSQVARGEVDQAPADVLTPDAFASAVRQFMGVCQVMPHSSRAFALMDEDHRASFDANLRVIEDWAVNARAALDTISGEVIAHE